MNFKRLLSRDPRGDKEEQNLLLFVFNLTTDFYHQNMSEEANLPNPATPSPFKNLTGAAIAATLATGLYAFTNMVAHKLASAPLQTTNTLANRLATLVRTLLLAIGTGAIMIFAVIAVGLVLLTFKQVFSLLSRQK
jgi:hypothetical protein